MDYQNSNPKQVDRNRNIFLVFLKYYLLNIAIFSDDQNIDFLDVNFNISRVFHELC